MKGFELSNGDLSITNNEIDMIEGAELDVQTIGCVISTNKGEWIYNAEEGIDFDAVLGKHTNADSAKSEIAEGIAQVDETLKIDKFSYSVDKETRESNISFTAKNSNDETLEISNSWG